MIISQPTITEENQEISVSARVALDNQRNQAPDTLWFKFPSHYRNYVTDRSDGFIVGLLPSAMALGEKVIVEGITSPRLAYGLREYQQILNAWWPKKFKIVDIQYDRLQESSSCDSEYGAGSAFSGGVDSFYTLWKHLPDHEELEKYRITHCLMINGFDKDIDLDDTGAFRQLYDIYEPMMQKLGITLLRSRTNLQKFRLASINSSDLHLTFGAPITASTLVLGNLFSRFYIPASHSYAYETLIPMGAHPILDHLLSTETLQLIHDGANASRTEKIATISQWNETYSRLRVCLQKAKYDENTGQIENCGNCIKCINTMLSLDILDVLPMYATFPHSLKSQQIWKARNLTKFRYKEHLSFAHQQSRKDRIFDLYCYFLQNDVIYPIYAKIRNLFRVFS
ncbi:hypothetical protein VB713_20020 [Anabaena cylindrica UHCC 0172]|uniref:hypothetical protein n=1 Tax=Anabaena cylindrica TaxID=1165 RepID=UPI002B2174DD|nr:hypothetical protein [Anabaena cylindrica]MEA5553230.1 hypothetical protein [Anabaena cylindrica UHCC 0172]